MSSKFASLSLFPATPDQIKEARREAALHWGKEGTAEQYLERHYADIKREYGRDGKLITWVLAPRDSPGTLDFLSSCRTFRRRALVMRAAAEPEEVTSYVVASVFTPSTKRNQGYARHMMQLLHWVLGGDALKHRLAFPEAEWGAPPTRVRDVHEAAFSTLYSDVGPVIYRKCGPVVGEDGWVVRGPTSTIWDVVAFRSIELGLFEWTWLDEDEVNLFWVKDAEWMRGELARVGAVSGRTCFTFLPDRGVGEYQFRRTQDSWKVLSPPPKYWGIYRADLESSGEEGSPDAYTVFASWTIDVRPGYPKRLVITRVRARPDDFPSLLSQIVGYAREYGLARVDVWNLPADLEVVARSVQGVTAEREDNLPAVKWYGPEVDADVDWIFNEK